MGFQTIQNFLTLPELPDVIVFLFLVVFAICDYFLKKFVQRDNKATKNQVDAKVKELETAIDNFNKATKEIEKERKYMRREFKAIKKAIKKEANNSHELVANGTANEISKMLDDDNSEEVEEEDCER